MRLQLYTDGACHGNPGPAAIGYVILTPEGEELVAHAEAIGYATNNIAEYTALLRGLERCAELGANEVAVISDSELLVRQMRGAYQVRNARLRPLYEQAVAATRRFDQVTFQHVLRHHNARADRLASRALRNSAD